MKAYFLRPSVLAAIVGFVLTLLIRPSSTFKGQPIPLDVWLVRLDGLYLCFAGAIAAWALVEMYQRLRKP